MAVEFKWTDAQPKPNHIRSFSSMLMILVDFGDFDVLGNVMSMCRLFA